MRGRDRFIERSGKILHGLFGGYIERAAWAQKIALTRDGLKLREVFGHDHRREIVLFRVGARRLERIGRVGEEVLDAVLLREYVEALQIAWIYGLLVAAARITREELNRFRPDRSCRFSHDEHALFLR